ncbi:MAG: EAL domain-containing protein [Rhodoferax sp.]|nr:EAL domain-containing protein [Rhodoferax sp.]
MAEAPADDAGAPSALALYADLLSANSLASAAHRLVAALAHDLQFDRVSIGLREGSRTRLLASTDLDPSQPQAEPAAQVLGAMDEALEQALVLVCSGAPSDGDMAPQAIALGHQLLQRQVGGSVATPPLGFDGEPFAERLALGSALRGAVQRGELRLHDQPKLDVAGNRIIGAEALVRWQHPELGLVPPLRCIGPAEELGLINGIGCWVMQTACREAAQWARGGLGELTIAINVAKPQFQLGSLRDELQATMTATGLRPRQLVVELTESMLMDDVDNGRALIHEMKALGVFLSVDDFGTGYSSLSYLKSFPLDELKIDRSFVTDLPDSATDVAIVRAIVDLGHSLGMSVIAEGIETPEQLACM